MKPAAGLAPLPAAVSGFSQIRGLPQPPPWSALGHPVVGELALDRNTLTCGTDPHQHIIVWTAEPGSPSYDGLRLMASWAADQKRTASDTVT
ncbi:hypothetical protein SsS58_06182 [Streptomyces scabiei]|uniref:MmyB-like transcription regulator ligand binding domain-containing protein n=1 Tax=Streptomyces scabiei TaxID=1930 RepID=A0A124C4X0_STRSC|nr:hypothetical protein SsS58_06182 [Streptomyces scabiei]